MCKKLFFLVFFLYLIFFANAQTIGNIEKRDVWYNIYNEQGKKIKTVQSNIGELVGFGAQFFIVKHDVWYYLYDQNAKKHKTLQANIGEIVSVESNSFVVKKDVWLHIYNSQGKKISTRQAR